MTILDFDEFRIPLGATPTPLVDHAALGAALGVSLYLKREDLIDEYACGNKVRKLEYILGEARRNGVDYIVTAGGYQSNQCKAVAIYASKLGMSSHLLFCGNRKPVAPMGNYLVAMLSGAEASWVDQAEWPNIGRHLDALAERARACGRRALVIPPGASSMPGTLGYVRMAAEFAEQERAAGIRFDHIVLPTGSSGTQTGILVGKALLGRDWTVTGVRVLESEGHFRRLHAQLLTELSARVGLPASLGTEALELCESGTEPGYDAYSERDLDLWWRAASEFQLLLDPTYMLKALTGLFRMVGEGRIRQGSTVALVHTGGLYGMFGGDERLLRSAQFRRPAWLLETGHHGTTTASA